MILQLTVVFLVAFLAGYFAAGWSVKIKEKRKPVPEEKPAQHTSDTGKNKTDVIN